MLIILLQVLCIPLLTMELEHKRSHRLQKTAFASVAIDEFIYTIGGVEGHTICRTVERYIAKIISYNQSILIFEWEEFCD